MRDGDPSRCSAFEAAGCLSRRPALSLCLGALVGLGCGGEDPQLAMPAPPPPGLTAAEASRLPRCIEVLESARGHRAAAAIVAAGCSPACELDIPGSIRADLDQLLAFVSGRCARDAEPGQRTWRLAELGGAWIAEIYERAHNSHPDLAAALDEELAEVEAPLHLEARVSGLYHLPPAARGLRPRTEVYAVVERKRIRAGIAGYAGFTGKGARRKVGFGGPFPGRRVRLADLRAAATQLHATISDNPDATAVDRAPLLLADRSLPVARLRRVVRRLGRARLGVSLRGFAGEHTTHLNWIDRWDGTWLTYRPSRMVLRTGGRAISVPHRDGEIDWAGVRAALAAAGGGDLAIDPPAAMTVRELTVVLDQIRTTDSDPALFFSRRSGLEPGVAVEGVEVAAERLDAAAVQAALERRVAALVGCYRPVFADNAAEGPATVRLTVGRRGRAARVRVESPLGHDLAECVEAAIEAIRFPTPRGRRPAAVEIRLGFGAS
jgi:hypothetical protein